MRLFGPRFLLVAIAATVAAALAATPAGAAFPGRNGKIAFSDYYTDPSGSNEIYAIDPDGTGLARLTSNPALDLEPAWSPDGRKVAFASNRAALGTCTSVAPECDYDIYVMNADGSGVRRLTSDPSNDRDPAWSPDGKKIVFTSGRNHPTPHIAGDDHFNIELYVMSASGAGQTRITDYEGVDAEPAWSPDGRRIAFRRAECFYNCIAHLYRVAPDGTDVTQLTSEASYDLLPNWSPSGDKIVFQRAGGPGDGLYVMNPDGSAQTRLPGGQQEPAWSPDGQKIAFGYPGIGVMNPDGGFPVSIYPSGERPDWQPVGRKHIRGGA